MVTKSSTHYQGCVIFLTKTVLAALEGLASNTKYLKINTGHFSGIPHSHGHWQIELIGQTFRKFLRNSFFNTTSLIDKINHYK